jgi:hypothetical protein
MGDGSLMGVAASSLRREAPLSASRRALPEFELVESMDEFRNGGRKSKDLLAEWVSDGILEVETDEEGVRWYSLADEWADLEMSFTPEPTTIRRTATL